MTLYDKEIHKTDDGFALVVRYYSRKMSATVTQEYFTFEDVRKAYDELAPCEGDTWQGNGIPANLYSGRQVDDPELTPIEEAVYACR